MATSNEWTRMSSESARHKLSDAPVEINNEEALAIRLKEAWSIADKKDKEIIELKAQVKILKEVIAENQSGYWWYLSQT